MFMKLSIFCFMASAWCAPAVNRGSHKGEPLLSNVGENSLAISSLNLENVTTTLSKNSESSTVEVASSVKEVLISPTPALQTPVYVPDSVSELRSNILKDDHSPITTIVTVSATTSIAAESTHSNLSHNNTAEKSVVVSEEPENLPLVIPPAPELPPLRELPNIPSLLAAEFAANKESSFPNTPLATNTTRLIESTSYSPKDHHGQPIQVPLSLLSS